MASVLHHRPMTPREMQTKVSIMVVKAFFGWLDDAFVYVWGVTNMKNRRLGRFRFGDYFFSWFSIVILLLFSVASLIFKLSLLFVVFPLVYATIWLGTIIIPHGEQFSINGNYISVFWGCMRVSAFG